MIQQLKKGNKADVTQEKKTYPRYTHIIESNRNIILLIGDVKVSKTELEKNNTFREVVIIIYYY